MGLSASRPVGEVLVMANLSQTTSEQYFEADDDYQSYGLTLGLDTVFLGQSVSPYFILNKSDYQHDVIVFQRCMV